MDALLSDTLAVIGATLKLYGSHSQRDEPTLVHQLGGGVRAVQAALTQLGLDWPQFYAVAAEVYRCAAAHGMFESTGVKLTGGGQGGCVVCVVPVGLEGSGTEFLTDLDQVLDSLETDGKNHPKSPRFQVLWRSWRGNLERVGLRVERENGSGDLLGLPAAVRFPYRATSLEVIDAALSGTTVEVRSRQRRAASPSDVQRARGDDHTTPSSDLFISFDPALAECEVLVRGQPMELPAWNDPTTRSAHVLIIAIAALSRHLAVSTRLARSVFDSFYPTPGPARMWTRRALGDDLVEPFNLTAKTTGYPSRRIENKHLRPSLTIRAASRVATKGLDHVLSIGGFGVGSLRIDVIDADTLRALIPRGAGDS